MFRFLRITIAAVIFTILTLFFTDFLEIMSSQLHVLAEIQFMPAVLAGSVVIFTSLTVATLLFGRVYCSCICPLGIGQDIVSRISRIFRKKKKFEFSRPHKLIRAIFLLLFVVGLLGCPVLIALLEPYSSFGRMVTSFLHPCAMFLNNQLVPASQYLGYYLLFPVTIVITSWTTVFVALVTFLVISYLAWRYGRLYCNTVCPIGTILGVLATLAPFRVRIDHNKCVRCKLCVAKCKGSCLDIDRQKVDMRRCVVCFDCLAKCPKDAIHWGLPSHSSSVIDKETTDKETVDKETVDNEISNKEADKKNAVAKKNTIAKKTIVEKSETNIKSGTEETVDLSKRQFLTTLAVTAVAAATTVPKAAAETLEISWTGNKPYHREHAITPPGSVSLKEFQRRCTSCHLCVSKCTSKAIKPSFMEYGLSGIMQPVMTFDRGFCAYDCVDCGHVCPTGAIRPLTVEQKHRTQMGQVQFILENCVVHTDGTSCGACAEHCPTQAVHMAPFKDGLTIPETNTTLCIGCGACEYICPVRPFRAIHVEGNPKHLEAALPPKSEKKEVKLDDFGF